MRNTILLLMPACIAAALAGCSPTETGGPAEHIICYEQSIDGSIDIVSNNLDGTNPKRISSDPADDLHPAWSPDGSRIAFYRKGAIIVYDIRSKTETNITSDGAGADPYPKWTANGRVYVAYSRPAANPMAVYLIEPDGSARTKVFDYQPGVTRCTVYAWPDSRTFCYLEGTKLYQTTIDGAARSLVFDLEPGSGIHYTLYDIDRIHQELLVGSVKDDTVLTLAAISLITKEQKTLFAAEKGTAFVAPRYSRDGKMVALIEQGNEREYVSVYDGGVKRRIAECSRRAGETFSKAPLDFSWNSAHIAFTKRVATSAAQWMDDLCTVDVVGHEVKSIDKGCDAAWNPRP